MSFMGSALVVLGIVTFVMGLGANRAAPLIFGGLLLAVGLVLAFMGRRRQGA